MTKRFLLLAALLAAPLHAQSVVRPIGIDRATGAVTIASGAGTGFATLGTISVQYGFVPVVPGRSDISGNSPSSIGDLVRYGALTRSAILSHVTASHLDLSGTQAVVRNTVGSGTFGPSAADFALLLGAAKDNYLTSTVEGEIDALPIVVSQGLKGDATGFLVDVAKRKGSATVNAAGETGAPSGGEFQAALVDASNNPFLQIKTIPSFIESPGSVNAGRGQGWTAFCEVGTCGAGVYVDSETAANWQNYFVGGQGRLATHVNFAIGGDGRIRQGLAAAYTIFGYEPGPDAWTIRDEANNGLFSIGRTSHVASITGAVNITSPAATTGILGNLYSGTTSNWGVVGYQLNANQDYGSFGDANTHFGMVVNGGKSQDTAATTGSWQLHAIRYTGYAGATSSSFVTASQSLVMPSPGTHNNRGNWTGSNPACVAQVGTAPDACIGEEVDVQTAVAPANIREGLRISDTGSGAGMFGVNTDSALGMVAYNGGAGFKAGITLGDLGAPSTFPIAAGGNILLANAGTPTLRSYFDLSALQAPTIAGLVMPYNSRALSFGSDSAGGAILSTTSSNGGQLVYGDNFLSFNWATAVFLVDNLGNGTLAGKVTAAALNTPLATPASSSSTCTVGDQQADANYVYVCTATNHWRRSALSDF